MNWEVEETVSGRISPRQLLLHAGVTCLLFFLLQALLSPSPKAKIVAFVGALPFAVHPINTLVSAVGRAELLAAGFLMAGWLLHLRDQKLPALLCFVLALLSKESAIVFLPLVVLGITRAPHGNRWSGYAAMAGITLAYLGLLWKMQGGRFGREFHWRIPTGEPFRWLEDSERLTRWRWMYAALHFYPAVLSCDYSFIDLSVCGFRSRLALGRSNVCGAGRVVVGRAQAALGMDTGRRNLSGRIRHHVKHPGSDRHHYGRTACLLPRWDFVC